MAPKKKTQKMALSDFFADTTTSGSWADDDVSALPSAPAKKDPLSAPRRGDAGYLDSMPDRGSRAPGGFAGAPIGREEVPVPDVPPFTAFVGNLTFETDEEELKGFFSAQSPTSVRLVKDPMGKPKGFGYVEFGSKQGLIDALGKGMTMLGGRTIRVSVAEPPANNRPGRDFAPSAAEEASQWRRAGPLPTRDAPTPRRGPSFADGPGAGPAPERDLDWGSARGARFQPAPPVSDFRRDSYGAGGPAREPRESQFSGVADSADRWRSNKPAALAPEAARAGPGPRGPASGQSSPGLADTEQTWTRGSKLRTPAETPPLTPNLGSDSPQTPAAPLERKKLNLAPRSGASSASATPAASTSSSIFGAAKPIDTASREAQVEAKRQEERKKAAEERARKEKEEEAKIQAEADARAKSIADAREAVRKERGEPHSAPSAPASGAGRKHSQSQAPRQNSNSGNMPPRQNSNSNGSRPAKTGRSNSAQKTEDGFEIAKGSRRDREAAAAPPVKRDAPIRQGFSFAAAAGLIDESANESGKTDETDEDVTKRLAEVKV